MALSKASNIICNHYIQSINIISKLAGNYLEMLYAHPIITKSMTSLVSDYTISVLSYTICGTPLVSKKMIPSYTIFSLLLNAPIQHYFYTFSDLYVRNTWIQFLIERLIYTPLYRALVTSSMCVIVNIPPTYYIMRNVMPPIIMWNWKYMSLLHCINIRYVPPMFRDLAVNVFNSITSLWDLIQGDREFERARNRKRTRRAFNEAMRRLGPDPRNPTIWGYC